MILEFAKDCHSLFIRESNSHHFLFLIESEQNLVHEVFPGLLLAQKKSRCTLSVAYLAGRILAQSASAAHRGHHGHSTSTSAVCADTIPVTLLNKFCDAALNLKTFYVRFVSIC